eukprot:1865442-Prymnesium_polylepis.1
MGTSHQACPRCSASVPGDRGAAGRRACWSAPLVHEMQRLSSRGLASQTCGGTSPAASQSVAIQREGWPGAVASASPASAAWQPGCTAPLGGFPHTAALPRALVWLLALCLPRDVPS